MKMFGRNSQISINGKTYTGNNITINNDKVIIDGVVQDNTSNSSKLEIQILCNVDRIVSENSIYVLGDVNGDVEAGSSVSCDNIQGDVSAGSSVNCDDIVGSAVAGTSINCDTIKGNAKANRINQ